MGKEWWGGADGWAEDRTLVEWHLSQYLRARKDETLGEDRFDIEQIILVTQGPQILNWNKLPSLLLIVKETTTRRHLIRLGTYEKRCSSHNCVA